MTSISTCCDGSGVPTRHVIHEHGMGCAECRVIRARSNMPTITAIHHMPNLVIIFVTYVASSAALRPRVSMQSHGDMQNFLVYARHVRHTCARWYSSSHVRGKEERRCFQTEDMSQTRTRPSRSM